MEREHLISAIEAILFAAEKPVPISRIQEAFGEDPPSKGEIETLIAHIGEQYQYEERGFEIREAHSGYQFTTKKKNGEWVRRFLASKPFRLSRTALETLSIIAYRQPITRAEIDKVRGIDSSHLMRVLMEKGIIRMAGKADVPGKPVQYATTSKFLELIGLPSLADLPPLSELKELQGDTAPDPQQALEEGLEEFISNQITHTEKISERDQGLEEIEGMIAEAKQSQQEIYTSPVEREIAEQNEEAHQEFTASSRAYKAKKRQEERLAEKRKQQEISSPEPLELPFEEETLETEQAPASDIEPPETELAPPHKIETPETEPVVN